MKLALMLFNVLNAFSYPLVQQQ